jgi:hypothetical protein
VAERPEVMKAASAGLHEEFPDVQVTIESMVAEGDSVAVRLTFRGNLVDPGDLPCGRRWSPRASEVGSPSRAGR